jgi:hypothetical protein
MTTELDERTKSTLDQIIGHTPELGPTPDSVGEVWTRPTHRSWLPAAAAVVTLAGVGGVALLAVRSDPPVAESNTSTVAPVSAPGSTEPSLFPVLDRIPDGFVASAYVQRVAAEPKWSEALVARVVDGTLIDAVAVIVQAVPYELSSAPGATPAEAEVFGQPALVYSAPGPGPGAELVHVTWGDGPFFLASGADPFPFLGAAGLDALTADVSDDSSESPTLSIGPLPPEFVAISQPQSRGYETISATLSVGEDNFDISVSTWNPIVGMAMAGPLRSVEIAGGRDGRSCRRHGLRT